MWAGFWLGMVVYPAAWFLGGHVERFAAAVLIALCANFFLPWDLGDLYLPGRIANWVCLLIFLWLSVRSDRWWPLLMAANLALQALADVVGFLDPGISDYGVASAKIGLGYLVDLTLMFGVLERWLAGEAPAGQTAWARAHRATLARRRRKPDARHRAAAPLGEPASASPA